MGENQAPSSLTFDTELAAHLNASPAHPASAISIGTIGYHNFYADDVQEAISKLDNRLAHEISNRQAGQVNNTNDITTLQTVTSDINNIPGTLTEGKIDASIARDSEYQAGDTALQGQITSNDTNISTNASNISNNSTAISTHTSDTANPHSVTAAQTGAASSGHGHDSSTITDGTITTSDIKNDGQAGSLTGWDQNASDDITTSGGTISGGDLTMSGRNIVMSGAETVDGVDVSQLNARVVGPPAADPLNHETRITALEGTSNFTVPGYVRIGGLLIQWGEDTSTSDNSQAFSFPVAFTNNCLGVFLNRKRANPELTLGAATYTTTGFTINRDGTIDGSELFNWIAIGD